MATPIDLEAYFKKIGYAGERVPTSATLAAIQLRHTETIAFENLNPLMGWPVRLEVESIHAVGTGTWEEFVAERLSQSEQIRWGARQKNDGRSHPFGGYFSDLQGFS